MKGRDKQGLKRTHTVQCVLTCGGVLLLIWSWLGGGDPAGWQSSDTRSRQSAWHVYLQPAERESWTKGRTGRGCVCVCVCNAHAKRSCVIAKRQLRSEFHLQMKSDNMQNMKEENVSKNKVTQDLTWINVTKAFTTFGSLTNYSTLKKMRKWKAKSWEEVRKRSKY